jgi:hypothetical protein
VPCLVPPRDSFSPPAGGMCVPRRSLRPPCGSCGSRQRCWLWSVGVQLPSAVYLVLALRLRCRKLGLQPAL